MQQLRAVLGGVGLGALLPTLVRAKVKSLASLALLSLDRPADGHHQCGRLTTLGLCADVEPARMERV